MVINIWKEEHLDVVQELPQQVKEVIRENVKILEENYGIERTVEDLGGYVVLVDKSGIEELKQHQLKGIIPEYIDEIEGAEYISAVEQAEEGYSIDEQNLKIREYCEREGHEIYNLYEDRGISGKNITNRPGIKQLLHDATENKFDLVIVWKLNRISRKLLDILNIVELLNKHNIAFRSLTENFETETPSGKLQLNIMGAIGEFERETIAENVKMGLLARAKEGRWNGGVVLGYDLVELPNDGKKRKNTRLEINEKEANTVRRIFEL